MPLRFGVGLPGTFYYSARVFPRRRSYRPARKSEPVTPESVMMGLHLILIPAVLIVPLLVLGPLGLLVWAGLGWWLVRRVLRRRREEREPVDAAGSREAWDRALTDARRALGGDEPDQWRAYQVSLLDEPR